MKFLAATRGYSMVNIACLDDAFSECFKLEASPVEGQSLQKKEEKRRKRKDEKKFKNLKAQRLRSLSRPKPQNFAQAKML